MTKTTSVRTRVAPSPTGLPHIGTLLQTLLDYIIAKQHDGKLILRIEDTDQKRLDPNAEAAIESALDWISIHPDESPFKSGPFGPYRQSERLPLYKKYAEQLLADGHVYYCFCTPERLAQVRDEMQKAGKAPMYDKHCRDLDSTEAANRAKTEPHVVRLKVPADQTIAVHDVVRGAISFESNTIDDQVLLKSDGFPTYHLAVVVDDHLMEISHVVRGEEWLSSAPKHILLYDFFGWPKPLFFHTPTLRNPDKSKLSKRHGHTSVTWYQSQGFLPEAVINFLLSIVWTHPEQLDIFSLQDAVADFTFDAVHITGPIVDLQKLRWLNGQYIRALSPAAFFDLATPFLPADFPRAKATNILPLIHERIEQLNEIESLTEFFYRNVSWDTAQLLKRADHELVTAQLQQTESALSLLPSWTTTTVEEAVRKLQEDNEWHKRQFFMLLRYVVTGKTATPPLFETLVALGKSQTIERLNAASTQLGEK